MSEIVTYGEITTEEEINNQLKQELESLLPTLRTRSFDDRFRAAILELFTVFDDVTFDEGAISESIRNAWSDLNLSDSPLLDRFIELFDNGRLFRDSLGDTIGSRVATHCIDLPTGTRYTTDIKQRELRKLLQLQLKAMESVNDLRRNKRLRDQGGVNEKGQFQYLTLRGARMPRSVTPGEANRMTSYNGSDEYLMHTNFSRYERSERLRTFTEPPGEVNSYSYSAEEAYEITSPKTLKVRFEKTDEPHFSLPIQQKSHVITRLTEYGYGNTIEVQFLDDIMDAEISGGRSVPRSDKEPRSPKGASYTLQLRIPRTRVKYIMKSTEPGHGDSTAPTLESTVILSAYVTPRMGKKCSLVKFINDGDGPLELKNAFIMTIMPLMTLNPHHELKATSFPVSASFNDVGDNLSVLMLTSGSDSRNTDDLARAFNKELRETEQWSNIKYAELLSMCNLVSKQGVKNLGKTLQDKIRSSKFIMITENGVEFEDVENIRKQHPVIFKILKRFGLNLLWYQSTRSLAESAKPDYNEIYPKWEEFFNKSCGPSITHSENIRSPNEGHTGAKTIEPEILLVRLALSRILNVGIGIRNEHEPTNPNARTVPFHITNQKRANLTSIPLCVLKDELLVYNLTGSLGKLFDGILPTDFCYKDRNGNMSECRNLKTMVSNSRHLKGIKSPQMALNAAYVLFSVTSPLIRLGVDDDENKVNPLRVISPSGDEFDVSLIAEEICMKLLSMIELRGRATKDETAIVWHPLFCIIVNVTQISNGKLVCDVILMPSKRPSSLSTSYHNTNDVLREMEFNHDVRVHFAMLTENLGYATGLNMHLQHNYV
uniref:Uncharacterized protein n=1 Tax=viral metagenome TaxID=1070528 RepID=A0A2V0RAW4_9ZZZZ